MKKILAAAMFMAAMVSPALGAALEARIDLSSQRMTVFRNGIPTATWPVSTARRGYVTPTGTYRPQRMHTMWYSKKYHNSPMPYSIFFRGGYAIHGTGDLKRLGSPASHGCIRLHPENAKALFHMVNSVGPKNVRISITH